MVIRKRPEVFSPFRATRYTFCLDPRDRVYAVLRLLGLPYQQGILPDYSLRVEDVYRDLMVCYIRNSTNISLFAFISRREGLVQSWIPDLENRDLPLVMGYPCQVSGNSPHEIMYLEGNESLRFLGVHVGIIREVSTAISTPASASEILALCHLWEPSNLLNAKYIDGSPLFHAFLGTLLYGQTRDNVAVHYARRHFNMEDLLDPYLQCMKNDLVDESAQEFCH
jgi:hypothetical protein